MRDLDVDPDLFIPFEWRQPNDELLKVAQPLMPPDWRLSVDHFWTQAKSPRPSDIVQGWKIHVSSTEANARKILQRVIPVCIAHDTEFKFASDLKILRTLLSKNCARSQSGKFITIYPDSLDTFSSIAETIHSACMDFDGPYILSDRPYKSSRVVFFRYGGFSDAAPLSHDKGRSGLVLARDFSLVTDHRNPHFTPPDDILPTDEINSVLLRFTSKDISDESDDQGNSNSLFERFTFEQAIKFSNFGGVYIARDNTTDLHVIIKEARPHVGMDGEPAIDLLRKEIRLLNKLQSLGVSPKPVALIQAWDNYFLAQEMIPGVTLRDHIASTNQAVRNTHAPAKQITWLRHIYKTSRSVIDCVRKVHSEGIIFGDLSTNNIIIDPDDGRVRLIDFEGAFQSGVDAPTNIYTAGFHSRDRRNRNASTYEDDYYALGCILMAQLLPVTSIMLQKDDLPAVLGKHMAVDYGLDPDYVICIQGLLGGQADLEQCCQLIDRAIARLPDTDRQEGYSTIPTPSISLPDATLPDWIAQAPGKIISACLAQFHHTRSERIFALGPEKASALSLGRGALGIAYGMQIIKGCIPERLTECLEQRTTSSATAPYRHGLLDGAAGASFVLRSLGMDTAAQTQHRMAMQSRTLFKDAGLERGFSGVGIACLASFNLTQDQHYLDDAIVLGKALLHHLDLTAKNPLFQGREMDEHTLLGLHNGPAGWALFLLYLHAASGNAHFLDIGRQLLEIEIQNLSIIDGLVGSPAGMGGSIKYPYLASGSAGVLGVALRYALVTDDVQLLNFTCAHVRSLQIKYSVTPGLYMGLAGIGNVLLDFHQLLDEQDFRDQAVLCASGLDMYHTSRDGIHRFCDPRFLKINQDYADGSMGVALFLHRLMHGGGNFHFHLDEFLSIPKR